MSRPEKTQAVRLLERLGVAHETRVYDVDPEDLGAANVAAKIGLPADRVFKTLVVRGGREGVLLAVVPGDAELDLKALAKAIGDKKVETVALREVEPLTGQVRGGVTALARRRPWRVVLDASARDHDRIAVSAGRRGLQILLAPGDYVRVVGAEEARIARRPPS